MSSPLAHLFTAALALTTLTLAPTAEAQDSRRVNDVGPAAARTDEQAAPADDPSTTTSPTAVDGQSELATEQHAAEGQPRAGAARAPVVNADARPVDSLSHRYQLGVRIGAGVDGRFSIKYGSGPSCGTPGESFCRRVGTGLIDMELGFGVSDVVELSVLGRFGLADDAAAQARPLMLGLGVRAYASPHSVAKLFLGARAMLDLTSSDVPNFSPVDVGLRGEFGVIVDVLRYLGLYAQLGIGIHILNALNFIGDVTGGIQARFP